MTAALAIYLAAGLFACYIATADAGWQRVLMIVLWLPMFAYNLFIDFLAVLRRTKYDYDDNDEDT